MASASPTLTCLALAAVARRANPDPGSGPEAAFLAERLHDAAAAPEALIEQVRQALRHPASEDAALAQFAEHWPLSLIEMLSIALAAAVERDLMAGRAIAFVQSPLGGSRPTLGLLAESFGWLADSGRLDPVHLAAGLAIRSGLLLLHNEGAPLPEGSVSIAPALCLALGGEEASWPGGEIADGEDSVPLARSVTALCRRHAAALLHARNPPVLAIRAACSDESKSAAKTVAAEMKRRAFLVESLQPQGLAGFLLLRKLVPVFLLDPAPGETKHVPHIPLYDGPVLVVSGVDGSIASPGREVINWRLPVPGFDERADLWKQSLPDEEDVLQLARSHRLSAARIAQLGKLAAHRARLDCLPRADARTVRSVSRTGEGSGLESLAQLMPDTVSDEALVLGPELRTELESLLSRCRNRDGLAESLGAAAKTRYTPGVRALLVGPSGTGKTLAACWLATRLGLPLFRVDLSSITSKYIGETEKNLALLLSRAERTEALLLFDEADSLFGKRTDVRESHDRFANAQTNYLLQRIETFDGIAILTSNSRSRFDTGFSRRLDVVIEFPAPGPDERRALWQAHLGEGHQISVQELNLLAGQSDFAGGQIRNVVLAAAVEARQNGRVLDFQKLLRALASECKKAGRPMPPGLAAARAAKSA